MLNKKAQVSVFIVISAIIVLVGVFLFFNSQFDFFVDKETQLKNQVTEAIESCVEESALRGVFLLGFQGGNIELTEIERTDPTRHLDIGFKIPNWDSERGGVPTILSMESELNDYVLTDSLVCIERNLESLEVALDIEYDPENFEVFSSINTQNVVVEADFPVSFSEINREEIYLVESIYLNIENTRLGDLYELAYQIYDLESSTYLFEELILDQIYSASDYSQREVSMPSEGISLTCSPQVWTLDILKSNLANLNNNNFKYLQFVGTEYIQDVFDANLNAEYDSEDLRDYFYNNYVYDLPETRDSFANYRVDVTMPAYNQGDSYSRIFAFREFDVTPRNGQIVKPLNMKVGLGSKIPVPCVQIYSHKYTLDYDLMIRLTDTNEDGGAFFFQFPLRVNVENNNPKTRINLEPNPNDMLTATNDAFCSDEQLQYPVQVYARDIINNEDLSEVNISYKCINLQCDLGKTDRPFFQGVERQGAVPRLEANFPYCIGGRVIAEARGYHQVPPTELLNTNEELIGRDPTFVYDVELIPTKRFDVNEGTFLAVSRETQLGSRVYTEDDGFFYLGIESRAYDYESFAIWPNEQDGFLDHIDLLDSEDVLYNISVYYVGPNNEFKGFMELTNQSFDVRSGNTLEVTVPSVETEITEDTYIEFLEYSEQIAGEGFYGIRLI